MTITRTAHPKHNLNVIFPHYVWTMLEDMKQRECLPYSIILRRLVEAHHDAVITKRRHEELTEAERINRTAR